MKSQSIEEASLVLLNDVCTSLSDTNSKFVIVGGWVPYLRVTTDAFKHPGTRDVDVLFSGKQDMPKVATQKLLKNGFMVSAKHEFQLFRVVEISNQKFVFSVDLLHPSSRDRPEMFRDVLSLDIRDTYDPTGTRHIRSIAFGMSDLIFEEELWSSFSAKLVENGNLTSVPLLTASGCIISKLESALVPKRRRDVFDIFYLLEGAAGATVAEEILKVCKKHTEFGDLLEGFLKWVQSSESCVKNIEHFAPKYGEKAKQRILELLTC
tara:strand:+ start:371 stop:1165 length:795 start_codon:yes stop_codon:yes gene_type:complete